jgi:hypothetical protein
MDWVEWRRMVGAAGFEPATPRPPLTYVLRNNGFVDVACKSTALSNPLFVEQNGGSSSSGGIVVLLVLDPREAR